MKDVRVVLVAPGGYGRLFLEELLARGAERNARIEGIVQPNIRNYPELEALLRNRRIPVFPSLEEFYARLSADLAIIASPMQHHCSQTCVALEHGSHVLCEKPACSTVREAELMDETSRRKGLFLAIGYQFYFSPAMIDLKRDISAGKFGRPLVFKTLLLRPRSTAYYERNSWAGKKEDAGGRAVLDSVAHNAGSHNLHNMLLLAGVYGGSRAEPVQVVAELYRANRIENYDTAAARITVSTGAEIFFFGSHAVWATSAKKFEYRFEDGMVYYDPDANKNLISVDRKGQKKVYGDPDADPAKKLWTCVDAAAGTVSIPCGLESAARQEVACVQGMQASMPDIRDFPRGMLAVGAMAGSDERVTYVKGLDEIMRTCFEKENMPYEHGVPWSASGDPISLGRS